MCSACKFEMVIPADAGEIGKVLAGVRQMLLGPGWPEGGIVASSSHSRRRSRTPFVTAAGTIEPGNLQCSVACEESGELMIVVRDPGKGFDAVADPLQPENTFKGSGRGIYLINQIMDELRFAEGGRELRMRKRRS